MQFLHLCSYWILQFQHFGLHILAKDFDQDSWGKTPEELLGQIL